MQTAAATLAGNAWGARDEKKLHNLARVIMPLEVALMVISGGLLFIFAPQLMTLFSHDSAVISLGSTVLRMVAASEPFYGFSIIVEGMMQGVGNTIPPFVFSVLGMWLIRILGTYICVTFLNGGLISAWACMISHNMLLFFLYSIQYFTGKWKPREKATA
jgi:Na+-driven multidrug efflux pump